MRDYVIFSDSGTDISPAKANELGVHIIDLLVIMNGETKLNREVDPKEFYTFLRDTGMATTSAVNLDAFTEAMEPTVKEGKDILYLGFSSGLSTTYNAGKLAAEELSEKYPDAKIYAVDTLCASLGQGLLVYLATKKKAEGATIDELRDYIESIKLNLCHWFTVDDLMFLKRGGRVGAASAAVGTVLGIKPVMHVDNEGHLIKKGTARGRKNSLDSLFDKMKASVTDTSVMWICHGDCIEDAEYLAAKAKEELGIKEVFIDYTGVVIGCHSGPGTLAIFYLGNER